MDPDIVDSFDLKNRGRKSRDTVKLSSATAPYKGGYCNKSKKLPYFFIFIYCIGYRYFNQYVYFKCTQPLRTESAQFWAAPGF